MGKLSPWIHPDSKVEKIRRNSEAVRLFDLSTESFLKISRSLIKLGRESNPMPHNLAYQGKSNDNSTMKTIWLLSLNLLLLISILGYVTGAEFWGISGSSSFPAAP